MFSIKKIAGLALLSLGLVACGSDNNSRPATSSSSSSSSSTSSSSSSSSSGMAATAEYKINVLNATNGQPLSPVGIILHTDGYYGWQAGMPASVALEKLAEGGDASEFITQAMDNEVATALGSGPIPPGMSEDITISDVMWSEDLQITLATMLVNTNDAFSGVTGVGLGDLEVGEYKKYYLNIYDSGTEANSEAAATIPGPVGVGENRGYLPERDDSDSVLIHMGVISQDDGLPSSVLTEQHRFLSGSVMLTITRMN